MRHLQALLAFAVVLAASVPAQALARTATVIVDKLAYGPAPQGLHVGDSVEWINKDMFQHSVTARDGSFDLNLPPGGKATLVLKHAGTIAFYCKYHPGMKGVIRVTR